MSLSIKEVEHIAMLARLNLTDDEKERFSQQLSSVLNYADKLNELATDDVLPLDHILPIYNVFRDDKIQPGPLREDILSNAPVLQEGQYKVPRII